MAVVGLYFIFYIFYFTVSVLKFLDFISLARTMGLFKAVLARDADTCRYSVEATWLSCANQTNFPTLEFPGSANSSG